MRYLLAFVLLFSSLLADVNASNVKVENVTLDPVYMLPVEKFPKFQAKIELSDGRTILFCCPKAMFDFYFRPFNYPEYRVKEERDFKALYVRDYLSGKWIDAKKALYVFGSKLQGPKGDDLIPVRNKDALNVFMLKYGGTKVLTFPEVRQRGMGLIKYLDMP
ncbi:MAG: hypothetical protein C6H99_02780 [Epsilonproteobacteria bacterium]|nr:hypothetical protein [Campylobacterota bacterium]NPA64732.1 hypothetical protein [Campylobacterota bacterium]